MAWKARLHITSLAATFAILGSAFTTNVNAQAAAQNPVFTKDIAPILQRS